MSKQERLPKDVYFLIRYTNAVENGLTKKADYYRGRLEGMGFNVPVLIKAENTVKSDFEKEQTDMISELLGKNDAGGDIMTKMKTQDYIFEQLEKNAIENDSYLGRRIRHQYADSYAHYVVTKVLPTKVKIDWIDYCDGWQLPAWGKSAFIDIEKNGSIN